MPSRPGGGSARRRRGISEFRGELRDYEGDAGGYDVRGKGFLGLVGGAAGEFWFEGFRGLRRGCSYKSRC